MVLPWHLYVMAFLYVAAGLNHFRIPRMYERIIPPAFPYPKKLNFIAGAAEILLGTALCIPSLTSFAAMGIIALLIAVFPANVYMLKSKAAATRIPRWALLLRLPVQAVLIVWAFKYIDVQSFLKST